MRTAAATSESNPADNARLPALEQLPNDPETLKQMVLELLATLHQERLDKDAFRHRLDLLLRRLYGPRGERFDPNQLLLFAQEAASQDSAEALPAEQSEQKKPKRKCKPHGRRRLPENLPRQTQHHVLSEGERTCSACGYVRQEIGTEKSEQLDYRPASLFVVEHVVHKYACPCCSKAQQKPPRPDLIPQPEGTPPCEPERQPLPPQTEQTQVEEPMATAPEQPPLESQPSVQPGEFTEPALPSQAPQSAGVVIAAPKPAMPIARGLPGPGLLAHLIVSKYDDHLPLYRLENIYERQGLFLPRSTLCGWLMACGQLLRPLYQELVARVLQSLALHTDDTPVKLQDTKTHLLSTARL